MPMSALPALAINPSSRRCKKRRAHRVEWSATIEVTAAKLIWKLGPARASGRKTRTINAPVAISRMLIASRPSAIPASTSSAATQLLTVGTCAPVSIVYPTPATAATAAATSTRLNRRASRSLNARDFQRQEHSEGNHRRDVQAADRKQVREAAPPHRLGILLVHGILVAGGERDRDSVRPLREALRDMLAEALADAVQPARLGRSNDGNFAQRLSDGADAPEPGIAREIVGSGQRHRRRRREPGSHADHGSRCDALWKLVLVDRNPNPRRKPGIVGTDKQPHRFPRSKVVDAHDPARDFGDHWPIEARLRDPGRARPDQRAAE